MLVKDYYQISDKKVTENEAVYSVSLNAACEVYKGHFPGEPISPGVCNIQMIKECAEDFLGMETMLSCVQQCRFTTLITPVVHPQVEIKLQITDNDGEHAKLRAFIGKGEEVYLDLKAELTLL